MTATFRDWTPEAIARLRRLNRAGKSRADIALDIYKRYGLDFTPSQVRAKCRALGVGAKPAAGKAGGGEGVKKWHEPVLEMLTKMAAAGHGHREIADALNAEFGPYFSTSGVGTKLCRLRQAKARKAKAPAPVAAEPRQQRPGTRVFVTPDYGQIGAVTGVQRAMVTLPAEPWEVRT